MENIKYKIYGFGNINLVLLHGWGINKNIWYEIKKLLLMHFKLYLIDLPGYGENRNIKTGDIDHISYIISKIITDKCIWMGWSMGGIIASYIGFKYPKKTISVITIASSPCFLLKKSWPGIEKKILYNFLLNLINNYKNTIINFINLNTFNNIKNVNKTNYFNNLLLSKPYPTNYILKKNFNMICSTDLRKTIASLHCPVLRIYGRLDNIIPIKISKIIDNNINSPIKSIIMDKSAHIPFISQPLKFSNILINFKKWIIYNER